MNALRIIGLIVGLIVAVPFIAINVWGFQMTQWANEVTEFNEAAMDDAQDASQTPVSPPPMPVSPLAWLANRADLRDTFSTTELNDQRLVGFEVILEPEDILGADEAMPDATTLPLYAAARAPSRMIGYCAEVLQTIGRVCDVDQARGTVLNDGRIEFSGQLSYVPVTELGDPSVVENGELISAAIELPYDGDLRPANDPTTRIALIEQAQRICDQLRQEIGNCVLRGVFFDVRELWITDLERLPPGTLRQRLNTSMRVAVYAPSDTWNRKRLTDRLVELAAQP